MPITELPNQTISVKTLPKISINGAESLLMTMQEVCKIRDTDERHLNEILDAGRIDYVQLGKERYVIRSSFQAYQTMREERSGALSEMVRENQEMGLYD
ncbi:hypothetical protein FACS189427_11550 [Planctomycetales bacterium]|nr:hypothetical protein FACS189427_11550 [Planctomycetales bacterium]